MRPQGWIRVGGIGLLLSCLPLSALAAEPQVSPAAPQAATEGYVVKKGDTLWGIAKGLYDDPILWPRIWERNPFVTNPNRIFPGDTLVLPGRELRPAPEPPKVEAPQPAPVAKAPEVPEAPRPAPAPPAPAVVPAPPPPEPPLSEEARVCLPAVLDERDFPAGSAGKLVRADKNQILISQLDTVFIGLTGSREVKPGDRLAVIRPGQRVIHPVTKRQLGRVLWTLGILEVQEVTAPSARARVMVSCNAIGLGDMVQPYALAPFPVGQPLGVATRQLEGMVVETGLGESVLGQQQVVFVDVGSALGVGPGDVFALRRSQLPVVEGSQTGGRVYPIPPEPIGEGVIVHAGPEAATLLLTVTAKEALIGDRVVLSRQVKP